MPILTAFLFAILLALPAGAQFTDSTPHLISYAATGTVNRTNESRTYNLNNVFRFAIRKQSISFSNYTNWIYGQQQQKLTNNDFSTLFDGNLFEKTHRFYYWGLASYDKSYSLKIKNRVQAGAGIAYSFIDKPDAFFNLSDGILYESSKLKITDSTNKVYNTFRNSFRLRFKFTFKERLIVESTTFWQPSLQYKHDFVVKSMNTISFKLNGWLSIMSAVTYNNLYRLNRENLQLTYGLKAEKYY